MAAKRWDELSARQRFGIVVAGAIQLALLTAALTDLWRRPQAQVRESKRWWAAVSLVNVVGPLACFVFGRRRGEGWGGTTRSIGSSAEAWTDARVPSCSDALLGVPVPA